jgi:hypothetical protein
MTYNGYSTMIFGTNDGSPAIDGRPIEYFIEKYNDLMKN